MKIFHSIRILLLPVFVCLVGFSFTPVSATDEEDAWREEFAYTLGVQAYIYGYGVFIENTSLADSC